MNETTRYSLVFLFDGSQISPDELRQKAAKVIEKHLPKVDLQVKTIEPERLRLSIKGSLEDVDACHDKLNAELFDRHSCIRLIDEAGDEIRQQAYPILAQIEQLLRTFINRAMTEVIGFDWWDSMTPPSVRERVLEVEEKSGKRSAIHHPLEFTDFDHLAQIITGSVQEWPEGRPLSTADLLEVLSDCHSIDEVQAKLKEKVRRISLWDTVFARYFEEADQWSDLEKSLIGFVIPARNKVMHHRPMRLYELRELSHIEENVRALLASAKTELSEEERIETRQVGKDLIDLIQRQQAEMARAVLEPLQRQQAEMARAMLEPLRQQAEMARAALEPLRQQAEMARVALEPLKEQAEMARAVLEPLQRKQAEMARAALEPFQRQQVEMARAMLEPLRQQAEMARAALEPLREQAEMARVALEPLKEQAEMARAMLEPLRQQREMARKALESFRRQREEIARVPQRITELPMSDASESEDEGKDFEPDVAPVDDEA